MLVCTTCDLTKKKKKSTAEHQEMSLFCKWNNVGLHTFTLLHIPKIKTFVKVRTGCGISHEGYKIQKTSTVQKYYADLTQSIHMLP